MSPPVSHPVQNSCAASIEFACHPALRHPCPTASLLVAELLCHRPHMVPHHRRLYKELEHSGQSLFRFSFSHRHRAPLPPPSSRSSTPTSFDSFRLDNCRALPVLLPQFLSLKLTSSGFSHRSHHHPPSTTGERPRLCHPSPTTCSNGSLMSTLCSSTCRTRPRSLQLPSPRCSPHR
jgi:hypothetical protein